MNADIFALLLKLSAMLALLSATTSNGNIDIRRMTGDITAMKRNGNVYIRVTDGDVMRKRGHE